MNEPYAIAQNGITQLKQAIYLLLLRSSGSGLSNATIGRTLGIYGGHLGHEGHISRTILAIMESEAVVEQDPATKKWILRTHETASEPVEEKSL